MYTHPGKKLLMAGSELATWNEWHHESELERHLLQYSPHAGASRFVEDLGRLYLSDSALYEWDDRPEGFTWIDCHDHLSSVLTYIRRGPHGFLVCVLSFTPVARDSYRLGVPEPGEYREVINSDSEYYGGSNMGNCGAVFTRDVPYHGYNQHLDLILPPLSCLILKKVS
jgi:1,4-alpha-glucan branching enzyme